MMSPKHCPHCLKKTPLRKRFNARCSFCFKLFRRRSGLQDRSTFGLFLEDRSTGFWFFLLLVMLILAAIIMQISGQPDLLRFIDNRTFWFIVSIYYAALILSVIGRIFFPLLLGAPKILRRERAVIRQYRSLTITGAVLGLLFAMLIVGLKSFWLRLPAVVYLLTVPIAILWAFQALTLTEEDYEDQRVWSFLHELGAQDRLEHRHHAYLVLVGLPLSALGFYFFLTHPYIAHLLQESEQFGIISMLKELWSRTGGRG